MIGYGHRLADIRQYTLIQVQGFIALGRRYERMREVGSGSMTRAAFHATGKKWKELLKAMDADGD